MKVPSTDLHAVAVVGGGPGSAGCLTGDAEKEMQLCDDVFAFERLSRLAPEGKLRLMTRADDALNDIAARRAEGRRVAVLVSGDPAYYSMLGLLKARLGEGAVRVLPGIGALSYFAAKINMPLQDAEVLSAHGRSLNKAALCAAVRQRNLVMLFCDPDHSPRWAAEALCAGGLSDTVMYAGERLSHEDEKISSGSPTDMKARAFLSPAMVCVENPRPDKRPPVHMSDDCFIRGRVPMTKQAVRDAAVSALRPPRDAVIWDIGAGTGSVSVQLALLCPFGRVYAIERDEEALGLIARNAEKFGLDNITVVSGSAPEILKSLPAPTHVFLGGTGGNMADILSAVPAPVRLCAAFVTLDNAAFMLKCLSEGWKSVEAVHLAATPLVPVGGHYMLRAHNPVFLISAEKEAQA